MQTKEEFVPLKTKLRGELEREIAVEAWMQDLIEADMEHVNDEKHHIENVEWKPNGNIDLFFLEQYFRMNMLPKTMCTKGFKDTDEKNCVGEPIIRYATRNELFNWGTISLYKTLQLNTSESITAIIFDIDLPYEIVEPKLNKLVNDGLLPEPSYICVRHSTRHPHVVYLLNERVEGAHTDFIKNKVREIRMMYNYYLGADVGYSNQNTHNPFYEYLQEKRYSVFSDPDGFSVIPAPRCTNKDLVVKIASHRSRKILGRTFQTNRQPTISGLELLERAKKDGRVPPTPLRFKTYSLDELHLFFSQWHMMHQQETVIKNVANVCKTPENKLNGKALSVVLTKEGKQEYQKAFSHFATGSDFRNNTLFYNGLYFCKSNKIGYTNSDCKRLYQYLLSAYKMHYAERYPDKPPILASEIKAIAISVFRIHYANQNYVKHPRSWDDNVFGIEFKSQFKTFEERQKERAQRSVDLRRLTQQKRQQKLQHQLEHGEIKGRTKTEIVEQAAKLHRVSEKTIWRDITAIEQHKAQRLKSYKHYAKYFHQQGVKLTQRVWTHFLLFHKLHYLHELQNAYDNLAQFIQKDKEMEQQKLDAFINNTPPLLH